MALRCFFAMPFAPAYRYFYLYVKQHIESRYNIECVRVDDVPLFTGPIIEKIKDEIAAADLVIADISGANANVFYELGWAHAQDKLTILVAQDSQAQIPFDIRHLLVIYYEQAEPFLEKLDEFLTERFSPQYYEDLYQRAQALFKRCRQDTHLNITQARKRQFMNDLQEIERQGHWSYAADISSEHNLAETLLSLVIKEYRATEIRQRVKEWLLANFTQ